jgi:hypothetical protein
MRRSAMIQATLVLSVGLLCAPGRSTAQAQRRHGSSPHGPGAARPSGHDAMPVVAGHHHPAPEFGSPATVSSVRTGVWSDPATWSPGRLPAANDRVRISGGTRVGYDLVSDAPLDCVTIEAGGLLDFHPAADTRMVVGTLLVLAGGRLSVGSPERPIAPEVTAEVVIADRPLDLDDDGRGVFDPEQLGTGLLCWGRVTMHGAPRSPTFVRLAREAAAGDSVLTLEEPPSGWRPGDRLVLPDSRQVYAGHDLPMDRLNWETPAVREVRGAEITLDAPLRFDHPGARDAEGRLRFLPHVANLSRNVIVRSANPAGTRGHVMMTGRAEVDIRHALFRDLGRSLNSRRVDVAEHDRDGRLVSLAKNQIGRYSLHMHHLIGPERPADGGHQFVLQGNAIDGGDGPNDHRWGIVVHASHYGLIQDNVVYNIAGAGITTEDGTEVGNHFLHNIAIRTDGLGHTDYDRISQGRVHDFGHAGDGFWLSGPSNLVRGNVAIGSRGSGFNYYASEFLAAEFRVPGSRGADPSDPARSRVVPAGEMPFAAFTDNEAYTCSEAGLRVRFARGLRGAASFQRLRTWHSHFGFVGDNVPPSILEGFVVLGDPARATDRGGARGLSLGRIAEDVVVRGAEIQGVGVALVPPTHTSFAPRFVVNPAILRGETPDLSGTFLAEGCTFRDNRTDVRVDNASTTAGQIYDDRRVILRGCRFSHSPTPGYLAIDADLCNLSRQFDLRRRQEVLVEDFDEVSSDDFQVFFPQQAPDFVMPSTSGSLLGAPEEGLANREAWRRYRIAVGGRPAPDAATGRPEVRGLVAPIAEPPAGDVRPPVISGLRVRPTSGDTAEVTWTTDEPADTLLVHGRGWTGPEGSETSGYTTEHRLVVKRYSPEPGYRLVVLARDVAGNAATASWEHPAATAAAPGSGGRATAHDRRPQSVRRSPR